MRDALIKLREKMKETGIDVYLVSSDDFHMSEYVGEYFKCREYLTGFSGSAGTALVSREEALLFTDGRYFLQAEKELSGTGFCLCKTGVPGAPSLADTVCRLLPFGGVLGYDGRTVSGSMGTVLEKDAALRKATIRRERDLVGEIWEGRPAMSEKPLWILSRDYAGVGAEEKLRRVRRALTEAETDVLVLTAPEDVMWLLNLRGNDAECTPVALCSFILSEKEAVFFPREKAVTDEVRQYLTAMGVRIEPYEALYEAVGKFPEETRFLISPDRVNDRLVRLIRDRYPVVERVNPTSIMKAEKNETERECLRRAHRKDGIAMVRALMEIERRIKENAASGEKGKADTGFSECDAAEIIDGFRRRQEHFIEPSFETIAGYGQNGAIIHYQPVRGQDAELRPEGFLLMDSGGHYLEGTTDITRTWALGPVTEEEKKAYTLVLKGHLSLAMARFPEGTRGAELDALIRMPLWKEGMDYRHGTGHGIGYLLSVHEWPTTLSGRSTPEKQAAEKFREGMLLSDEPGFYKAGAFGVRIENDLLCIRSGETEYGSFLAFENLTLCPIDTRPILTELLNEEEKNYLNDYHRRVYEKLAPLLDREERCWLENATGKI